MADELVKKVPFFNFLWRVDSVKGFIFINEYTVIPAKTCHLSLLNPLESMDRKKH